MTPARWVLVRTGSPRLAVSDFVRAVAHALVRNGHTESGAIQMAIGVIRNWAEGKGNVKPKTRAKAAETIAAVGGDEGIDRS